jgi:hypothetical protein
MRGLVGERLLKRLVGSILRRPSFDSPEALETRRDNGEATPKGASILKPEKAEEVQVSEKPEATNAVISLSDAEN